MFVYGLALEAHGREHVMRRVGVQPSGDAFNSRRFTWSRSYVLMSARTSSTVRFANATNPGFVSL
jgi:Glutaminase